jgi:CRP-like cAMP-binding protein
MQTVPLKVAIAWSLIFIAINIYWIIRLMIERRPVHFTPDEERLRQLSFPSLTPREAHDLFAKGIWYELAVGDSVVGHDRVGDRFSVILRGIADVIFRNKKVAELGEGQFVGDIDLRADASGDLDVLMRTAARVMCWPRDGLTAFLAKRPDVALSLQRSVGFELQQLLGTAYEKLSNPPEATT